MLLMVARGLVSATVVEECPIPLRTIYNNASGGKGFSKQLSRCDGEWLVTMETVGTAETIATDLGVSAAQHHRDHL